MQRGGSSAFWDDLALPSSEDSRSSPGNIRQIAGDYLRAGWPVIPIVPHGKRPSVAWLEYQQRLPTNRELDAWFSASSDANIGIVTGAISGLVVVDVDASHDGTTSLRRLQHEHGALPATVEAHTGDGGCVVAPPSMHATGHRYKWAAGRSPTDAAIAALPKWLSTAIAAKACSPDIAGLRHL